MSSKLTRPFRRSASIASNFWRAQAWNPLRWRLLASQISRTVRTLGLKGALDRAQRSQQARENESLNLRKVEPVGKQDAPERISRAADPEVSIIIPVMDQWVFTAACLRSLTLARGDIEFEVILVDDQSEDETENRLESLEGLIYLRNDVRRGFVKSLRQGIEKADGKFIVLLENNTQVMDGWLDALAGTFKRNPLTGLAGPRLLRPDGTLHEAGGILFNNGAGVSYGQGDDPKRPDYCFSREIDYCSAACVMIRAEQLRELTRPDSPDAPENWIVDLAFRVRAAGRQVRIQPDSNIVIHQAGAPSWAAPAESIQTPPGHGREIPLRWKTALDTFPDPPASPEDRSAIRRVRDHRLAGRVLIIDAFTPEPDRDSGSLRLRNLMDSFREIGYGVTFLPDSRTFAGRYTSELQQSGTEAVYDPWIGSLHEFFRERGAEFDLVMVCRHYVASRYLSLLKRYCTGAHLVFDTVDLHYLREQRLAELKGSRALERTALQTRRAELAVIDAADATLVVSPAEKSVLAEAAPGARVHVVSNVHEVVGSRRGFAERRDILFVGSYRHPPNVDAVTWFTESIWPLVRAELPDAGFHMIGSKAPEQVRTLEGSGVQFHGFVEDLEPWLDECRLAVAPLRYGAGIKGKINMSMSRGQPVVATPVAAEGTRTEPGRDLLVAETAEEFAAEVVKLYRDEALWNQLSTSGLENVRKYFSRETAQQALSGLIGELNK